jgi:hypothetical protein
VIYYPYLRLMRDMIQSAELVEALRGAGFKFRELRSVTEVV